MASEAAPGAGRSAGPYPVIPGGGGGGGPDKGGEGLRAEAMPAFVGPFGAALGLAFGFAAAFLGAAFFFGEDFFVSLGN